MNVQQALEIIKGILPIEDPTVAARLGRACGLLQQPGYNFTYIDEVNGWHVEKASTSILDTQPSAYSVTKAEGCSCPDAVGGRARAGLCKHALAVMLLEQMRGTSAPTRNEVSD